MVVSKNGMKVVKEDYYKKDKYDNKRSRKNTRQLSN